MGHTVQVRNMTLGEGLPKICVPLTDPDLTGLKQSVRNIQDSPLDFVEWRADFYAGFQNEETCAEALSLLREELGDIPVLFTIRTKEEGGQADISAEEYKKINLAVIESGLADLVDVELSKGDDVMSSLVEAAHKINVKIVGSRHDFDKTPNESFIVESLCQMQKLGADVAKFAVMPNCERDVLTLLSATVTMKEKHNDTPVITMSMGRLGALSRVCGTLSGSAVTFGTAGRASAPGQLPADLLKTFLESLA
ncbi:MAG: type I 3-dehydroquinate dehydratase [Lachnospiraceae bacterium]|nr:type I 3-dehydroquinate dehydratase [Lachnospiraceae bacterium]